MSKSTLSTAPDIVHVAVAIVVNSSGEILISKRPKGVHLEGLWEFPGGKIEAGETVFKALQREMFEETGLEILSARPLICITHDYPEKTVRLNTWLVEDYLGQAKGLEGQEVKWVDINDLQNFNFPAADQPILSALNLPFSYQISPEPGENTNQFLNALETCLSKGQRLFQLRAKALSADELEKLSASVKQVCLKYKTKWLINGEPEDVKKLSSDGVHLCSERLLKCKSRPLSQEYIVAASCHNLVELKHAEQIGVDFVVLAPVKKTMSHPETEPLGLAAFERLVEAVNIPVYALGGMSLEDQKKVWNAGGQGVAMIRAGWPVTD